MDKQASKTLIGAFVVGAVVLIVAGVLIFGSGKLMKKTDSFVLFFKSSLQGLNVGSPVLFRGVRIGSVKNITIEADPEALSIHIPVIIEIVPDKIKLIQGERARDVKENLPNLIEKGLRAQLKMGSLLTGQLIIELEFSPDAPAKVVGLNSEYPEIPTIPSALERISDIIKDLPFDKIVDELLSAVEAIEKLASSPDIPDTLHSLKMTVEDARKLLQNLDSRIGPLAMSIDKMVKEYGKLARDIDGKVEPLASSVDATLKDARKLVRNVDGRVKPLASSIEKSLEEARTALEQARKALVAAEKTVGKESPVIYQFDKTLKEISRMARSIRSLADYLERHPDALLYGKGKPKRR